MPNAKATSALDQFLRPEAMVTPGVAGAMTMMIANTLATSFLFPRAWIGLALSFLFGLLVLVSDRRVVIKGVFYLINSFVIFCVAQGANNVGVQSTVASLSVVTPAVAAPADASVLLTQAADTSALQAQYDDLSKQYATAAVALDAARAGGASPADIDRLTQSMTAIDAQRQQVMREIFAPATIQSPQRTFFAPWKF